MTTDKPVNLDDPNDPTMNRLAEEARAAKEPKVTHPSTEERYREVLDAMLADADKASQANEPTDAQKLEMLARLGITHAENQVELHRLMMQVARDLKHTANNLGNEVVEVKDELMQLNKGINDYLDEFQSDAKNSQADDDIDEEEAEYDSAGTRAYAFLIRCAGIGLLVYLIAVSIVKVFPEGI